MSRYRDPQLEVGENYLNMFNLIRNMCSFRELNALFSFKFSALSGRGPSLIYDDSNLKQTLWFPWFIQKIFGALRVNLNNVYSLQWFLPSQ